MYNMYSFYTGVNIKRIVFTGEKELVLFCLQNSEEGLTTQSSNYYGYADQTYNYTSYDSGDNTEYAEYAEPGQYNFITTIIAKINDTI